MHYQIRPGVTLVKVCGTDLLVSTRSSWDECAGVKPVPLVYAGCIKMLEKGMQQEEIVRIISKALKKPSEDIQEKIKKVFLDLYKQGFLIIEEDDNERK